MTSKDRFLFDGAPAPWLHRLPGINRAGQFDPRRGTAFAILITWVPLVVLALAQGTAFGAGSTHPLLRDVAIYVRFLVALPILLFAPTLVRRHMRQVVEHFVAADIVIPSQRERFLQGVNSTMQARDSRRAALVIAILAWGFGFLVLFKLRDLPSSWRVVGDAAEGQLSIAGWWAILVSQPAWMFLLLSFLYRIVLWWRFLWLASRLDLEINPAHPDGAGGLAFLGSTLSAFAAPIFAIAAAAAGNLADLVLWAGASLANYKFVVALFAVVVLAVFIGPLLFFAPALSEAKRRGLLQFAVLAGVQLREFEGQWLVGQSYSPGDTVKMTDSSAIADFHNMVATVRGMATLPFGREEVITLGVAALLPFIPVVALEIPLKDIVLQLVKMMA